MTVSIVVHAFGGIIAILSGWTSMLARKGSRVHRKSGDIFVVSMIVMAVFGGYVAYTKSQTLNVFAAIFTFYLVSSAWLTAARRPRQIGRAEYALLLLALGTAIAAFIVGANRASVGRSSLAAGYFIFGSIGFLSAGGDIRLVIGRGVEGAKRMVRHLWRMCFALFVATASFFIGTASDPVLHRTGLRARLFPEAVRKTHLPQVPALILVVLTIFWLCRVLFTDKYKTPKQTRREAMAPVLTIPANVPDVVDDEQCAVRAQGAR